MRVELTNKSVRERWEKDQEQGQATRLRLREKGKKTQERREGKRV